MKCFKYGEVRNFAVKCPYKSKDTSDEEDHSFKERKRDKPQMKKYIHNQDKSIHFKDIIAYMMKYIIMILNLSSLD